MCVSLFSPVNQTECVAFNHSKHLYFNSLKEAFKAWSRVESNCSNDSSITSVIIKELDAGNTLHQIQLNVSRSSNENGSLDLSQYDFLAEIWLVLPAWEVALKSTCVAPVVAAGALANLALLVLLARASTRRAPTGVLVASMALADLSTLLLSPWMLLVHHFYQNYMLGPVGCKMEGFISGSLLITSVMNLCVISYDRLTAIVLPQEARLSTSMAIHLAAASWIIGIVFATPLCVWRHYKERQWKNFLETFCWENIDILPMYWHVLLFILVWLPLTIMAICYSAIFWKLERYEQQILRREHPVSVSYKTRVARTIFIILISFIVCRLPFTVMVFIRNYHLKSSNVDWVDSSFQTLWFISHFLIYLNCAINPIIYGLTNENYRKALGLNPLYKWLSKSSKHTKEGPARKKSQIEITKSGKKKETWYRFWISGKISISNDDKDYIKSSRDQRHGSPIIGSSKITPLPPDNHM